MFTFFEGPEPSDGLRVKKISSASSTDCDMMIGGRPVRRRAVVTLWDRDQGSVPRYITNARVTLLPEFLYV